LVLLLPSLAACPPKGAEAYNEAQQALKKGKLEQAIAGFGRAVRDNPDFGEAYYNRGAARYRLAVNKLDALVQARGSAELKGVLAKVKRSAGKTKRSGKAGAPPVRGPRLRPGARPRDAPAAGGPALSPGTGPLSAAELARLRAGLAALPLAQTAPILALLRQSFQDKTRAHKLFAAGRWLVVDKRRTRRRMLADLQRLERLRAFLYGRGSPDRGWLLMTLVRPSRVPVPEPRPRAAADRPGTARPDAARPDAAQPDAARPGVARPDAVRSGAARRGTARRTARESPP
jgi:tetratricopeptide (TPR) repeat protein